MDGNRFSIRRDAAVKVGGNQLVEANGHSAAISQRLGRLLMVDRLTPLRPDVAERMHTRAVTSATVQNRVMSLLTRNLPGVGSEVNFVAGYVPGAHGYFERGTVKRSVMGLEVFGFTGKNEDEGPYFMSDTRSDAFYALEERPLSDGNGGKTSVRFLALVRHLVVVTEAQKAASSKVA